jgi:hypothetical protein
MTVRSLWKRVTNGPKTSSWQARSSGFAVTTVGSM